MADVRADQNRPVGGEDLDRNAFLRLFTTQLQNQNPLDPMKNEQFVAQLAQFSTLEATYSMSDSLGKFVESQQTERMLRSSNLLGKQVFAPQVSMQQNGGNPLDGVVKVDQVFESLELYVVDAETGQIVNQMDMGPQAPGELPFTWNGGTLKASRLPQAHTDFRQLAELEKQLAKCQFCLRLELRASLGTLEWKRFSLKLRTDEPSRCLRFLKFLNSLDIYNWRAKACRFTPH